MAKELQRTTALRDASALPVSIPGGLQPQRIEPPRPVTAKPAQANARAATPLPSSPRGKADQVEKRDKPPQGIGEGKGTGVSRRELP